MRSLAIFLLGLLVVFGALGAYIISSRPTDRAFVLVDSSFPMREVWRQVPGALEDIDDGSFVEFALATEKNLIHSWQEDLSLGEVRVFAPCDFADVGDYVEADEADARFVVTTPASCPTDALGAESDWTVIELAP